MNLNEMAQKLQDARRNRKTLPPLTANEGLSLSEAYTIQEIGREMRLAEGEALCGYKMGLTSRAKQRDVQVFSPIHGYLLRGMEIMTGRPVTTASRIHPRAEPEIAVTLKQTLKGTISLRELIKAIDGIYPALEILDSRYENFSFRLPDVIADNTSASGFMLGNRNYLAEIEGLPLLGVSVRKNGEILETGTPAAVLGNPLLAVVDLIEALGREGRALEAGMVVLTGGITASLPFQAGDLIEVDWPGETISFKAE